MTRELVERAQAGDHEAFEVLIRPAYRRLEGLARRLLRDPYLAEDAAQDAVVRAWRELRGLRDPLRFDAWLHRLVVNASRDQLRRGRRRPVEVTDVMVDRPDGSDGPEYVAARDELDVAFRRLSIEHRAVLVLTHYLGYSAQEIGVILGVPTGTVYSRLHNATNALRRAIGRPAPSAARPAEDAR